MTAASLMILCRPTVCKVLRDGFFNAGYILVSEMRKLIKRLYLKLN